jgi:hypothetical protein
MPHITQHKLPPSSSKATVLPGSFLGMLSALGFTENNENDTIRKSLEFF